MRACTAACWLLSCAGAALPAQDRLLTEPVEHAFVANLPFSRIKSSYIDRGYRITDLEVTVYTPRLYTAALVKQHGSYRTSWWYALDVSAATIRSILAQKNARLIDIDITRAGSSPLFTAIFVRNQGAFARTSSFIHAATASYILSQAQARGMRVTDLQRYAYGSSWRYAAILEKDPANDQRKWKWYLGGTWSQINSWLSANKLRPLDLDMRNDGKFNCVGVDRRGERTAHFTKLTAKNVLDRIRVYEMRVTDVTYFNGRYTVVLMQSHGSADRFGAGCVGSNSRTPIHEAYMTRPKNQRLPIGSLVQYTVRNAPSTTAGAMIVGFSKTSWGPVPLPMSLDLAGAIGCKLNVQPAIFIGMTVFGGTGAVVLQMPGDPRFVGAQLHTQCLVVDRAANRAGFTTSAGLTTTLGPRY